MTESSQLLIIIFLVILNLFLIFIYLLEYRRNHKLLGISKKFGDAERLYKKSQESANQLLNQTIAESELIIDRAYKEATMIVTQMRKTTEKIDSKTEAEMQQMVVEGKANLQRQIDSFASDFKATLAQIGQNEVSEVKTMQDKIYQEVLVNLNQLIANLKSQALVLQEQAGSQVQAELKAMQTEVQAYKKQQIEKMNANLYEILLQAARRVLGEGLSLSVQKETVLKAIDEAKRSGMIS
jgi:F0F1-type ATP synthase membrane subunit b/b'